MAVTLRDGVRGSFYMLAGYMKVAQMWMEEENRRPPEKMAKILVSIVNRDFPGM